MIEDFNIPEFNQIKEEIFQNEPNQIPCMNSKKHNSDIPQAIYMTRPDGLFSYCEMCANSKVNEKLKKLKKEIPNIIYL